MVSIPDGRGPARRTGVDEPPGGEAVGEQRNLLTAHPMLVVSSPRRHGVAVGAWVRDALDRGERVLCKHAPTADAVRELTGWLSRAGVHPGPDAAAPGPLGLLDAGWLHARSRGGSSVGLREIYTDLVQRACADGFTGLAVTGDGAALRASTGDEQLLRAHERDLDILTGRLPLRALCRFHDDESQVLVADMLGVHHRAVGDHLWDGVVVEGCLWVRGELDMSNIARLAAVLHAAVLAGVTTVDLSRIEFCSAGGLDVFAEAADAAVVRGRPLVLRDPPRLLGRIIELLGLHRHPGIVWTSTGTGS